MNLPEQEKRRRFPPPPPPPQYRPQQQQHVISAHAATSYAPAGSNCYTTTPSGSNVQPATAASFTNPYYASQPAPETTSTTYSNYPSQPTDHSINIGTDSGISKRPSMTQSVPPQPSYNSRQQPSYASSSYSRNANAPIYPSAQSYMLKSSNIVTSTTKKYDNNVSIALLLLPPLLLLLTCEMSTPLPLLLFLCLGLIVYAIDLANPGDSRSNRGYFTLFAVWGGWMVMSLVVGYHLVVLDGHFSYVVNASAGRNDEIGEVNNSVRLNSAGVLVLIGQVMISAMLLFCVATWTTLQFKWLPHQIPQLARLLERTLYFTLPPTSAGIVAYKLTSLQVASSYITWGIDSLATLFPYLFAFHLALGIWLVGAAPSMIDNEEEVTTTYSKEDKKDSRVKSSSFTCAIHPREGKLLSNLLVLSPSLVHIATFRQRIIYSYASWDDLFDCILVSTIPYLLHYLLASKDTLDERWRRSLNWFLRAGTSRLEGGYTIRGVFVPMVMSLLACISFQQRYLISLCAWASYIMNGHEGVISSVTATAFLTLGTLLMYATFWFFGRQHEDGSYLLGEYHEDVFQLLLALSAICLGLSCSPPWSFLPVPMLLAESIALWVISKQLRYAALTVFVFFTCGSLIIAYRLTFLNESVEFLPKNKIRLKGYAQYSMFASMLLIFFVGLVHRSPGGVLESQMKKWDSTGICLTMYSLFLVVMEFALLRCPMPVYSRDNFEVGRVAVYSPTTACLSSCLCLVIAWHLYRQKLTKTLCTIITSSIVVGKIIAVLIEEKLLDGDDSLRMIYIRWVVTTTLLIAISAPYVLNPVHVKISVHAKRGFGANGKPSTIPKNASLTVASYCVVVLPLIILVSVRLVIEPLLSIMMDYGSSAYNIASPKRSVVIGYSISLWGFSVLQMINHFLPDGGADTVRRLSALIFVMGLFISFSAPAIPGTGSAVDGSIYKNVFNTDASDSNSSGGWGLISAFLAILLAMTGPLELREVMDASGRKDTSQLLRLMIFGTMFGCGLAWFITMQSMNKDIFIPIFVTSFSTMAMSFLGTVASVMAYFLHTKDFGEAEQIANVWVGVGFPVFFVISSISLSAHAHPFGIGGWASTYLSVCGLVAGAFTILVRLREDKSATTRGYGNASCVISWLCAISVVYGRYGVSGVGVVGMTSVAGIPMSVFGTFLSAPILMLLEGEPSEGNKKHYQPSSANSKKGLVIVSLTRSNWFAPLLAGTVSVFISATVYAIFLRGCGLSKFSLLFGAVDETKNLDTMFSPTLPKTGPLADVTKLAQKSIVHTKTMIGAARLNRSGIWTSKSFIEPILHLIGLVVILPGLHSLVDYSWTGKLPPAGRLGMLLPLSILSMLIGKGIPSLVAAALITFMGGLMNLMSSNAR